MAKPPSIVVLLNNHDNVVNIERELVRANGSVRIDALKNKFLKKDFKIKRRTSNRHKLRLLLEFALLASRLHLQCHVFCLLLSLLG